MPAHGTRLRLLEGPPQPVAPRAARPVTSEALLRALDLTVRRRVEGLLAGEYRAAAIGIGTELAQVRLYQPGDDVRRIDWNVTARTLQPHVRAHVAERALAAWVVLDRSASMRFGTADRLKAEVADGVALAIGHLATRRGNRLGVVTFGGPRDRVLPARQGRAGLLGLLTAAQAPGTEAHPLGSAPVHGAPQPGARSSAADALRLTGRLARQRAVVIVVADFRGPIDWTDALRQIAARHDVVAVEVVDPREQSLPDVGQLVLEDPETGRQLTVHTGSRRLRERFAAAATAERADVAAAISGAGADHVVVSTAGDWLRTLAGFLHRRATLPARSPSRLQGSR